MNIISQEAIEKLQLPNQKHPQPYKLAWIDDHYKPPMLSNIQDLSV